MRTRVKICGITRLEDAMAAIEAGADALGFVFYPPSPRHVSAERAAAIIARLPAFVTTTALFVNAHKEDIEPIINQTQVDLLQFHGDEPAEFCQSFNRPYIKAIRVTENTDFTYLQEYYKNARALLLDSYVKGVPGGTGATFNWKLIPKMNKPIILAGGLNSSNVATAISEVGPYAVDVSGGVEQQKGIKSEEKIQQFMTQVMS